MVGTLPKTVLSAFGVLVLGCAPWSAPPATYVTVEADARHDTEKAHKDYKAARKVMEKHVAGKDCDFAKAEQRLRDALAADVRFGPAHHSLGVLYFWQRKLYLAAWEFEYAARLMPDRFEPLNNLGLVYESAGKYEQSKTFYCLAREKSPNNPDIIANLARVSFRKGETVDEMRPLFEDVLATDTRPEWRRWAAERLGLNPTDSHSASALSSPAIPHDVTLPPKSDVEQPVMEELPLLPHPMPDPKAPALYFDEAFLLQ